MRSLVEHVERWAAAGADSALLVRAASNGSRARRRGSDRVRPLGSGWTTAPRSFVAVFAIGAPLDAAELARRVGELAHEDAAGLPPGLHPYALVFRRGIADLARVPVVVVLEEP